MVRRIGFISVLVLALFVFAVPQAEAQSFSGYIDVTNATGYDIYYLYISHESSGSWEEDVLGSDVLLDGETVRVTIQGYPTSIFDLQAVDSDGDTYTLFGIDVAYEDAFLTLDDLD